MRRTKPSQNDWSMRDRFTRKSRTTRGSIPKRMKQEVYRRDEHVCVYCKMKCGSEELTIDHMIPLALGGLDEMTNWVTCCRACNQRKAAQPLEKFLESLAMPVEELPVYGDPVIDNPAVPIQLRLLRRRISTAFGVANSLSQGRVPRRNLRKRIDGSSGRLLTGSNLRPSSLTFPVRLGWSYPRYGRLPSPNASSCCSSNLPSRPGLGT